MSSSNFEIKQIFEYELRRKLSLKAKQSTSEVMMLINAFRFYDIMNGGSVNKDQWIKTIGKIGLTGFTDKDLSLLFDYYDYNRTQTIDYKQFSNDLYNEGGPKIASRSQVEESKNYTAIEDFGLPQQQMMEGPQYVMQNNSTRSREKTNIITHQPIESQSQQKAYYPPIQQQPSMEQQQPQMQQPQMQQQQLRQPPMQQQINAPITESYSCQTPLKFEVKKYFKYLLEILFFKVNIRNGIGYFTFASKIKALEDKIYKGISFENYYKCLIDMQFEIQPKEAKDFFSLLDLSDRGFISTDELLRLLRGSLSEKRKVLIINQYAMIDTARRGQCDIAELKRLYNAREHPEVKFGRKTEKEIYQEFLYTLDTFLQIKNSNRMTIDDFIEYYSVISASVDNEEYFEMMIMSVWKNQANEYNEPIGRTGNNNSNQYAGDTRQRQEQIQSQQQQQQQQNPNQIRYNPINNTYVTPSIINSNPMPMNNSTSIPLQRITPLNDSNPNPSFNKNEYSPNKQKEYITQSILKLRHAIISRGSKGIFGLQRMFKMYDRNGSGKIHIADFDSLCQAYRISLTQDEINAIFSIFDTDHIGEIKYDFLVVLLTGEINDLRLNLVKRVFSVLDKSKTGLVNQNDMKMLFTAQRHPDVVMNKKTEDEVLGEWLDNLDSFGLYYNIPLNQAFTIEDFVKFYTQIGMSIEDDRYFDYMINNVWNLDKIAYNQQQPLSQIQQQQQQQRSMMKTGNDGMCNRPY